MFSIIEENKNKGKNKGRRYTMSGLLEQNSFFLPLRKFNTKIRVAFIKGNISEYSKR